MAHTVESERTKYQKMWEFTDYRKFSPAEKEYKKVLEHLKHHACENVLDLGCGTGRLAMKLADEGFSVRMVDIAANCLDQKVNEGLSTYLTFEQDYLWSDSVAEMRADCVICIDVLEHIPPEHVDKVCQTLRQAAPHGYVNAALYKDGFGKRIRDTLHLTVRPSMWWFDKFPDARHTVSGSDAWIVW